MILVSSCSCLCPLHWNQGLSREWRCSWSSANRRCSNYIWVINDYIAYKGVAHIRGLTHSLLSLRWVNTSSSCWRQTRTPPSRTPALLGLGWIPPDLGAFNLGLIAPVTAQTLGYRSAWSPGTALSHLGSAQPCCTGTLFRHRTPKRRDQRP